MTRTIEVDWSQDYTTIFEVVGEGDDQEFVFSTSTKSGPMLERVTDPEGGPDLDRDRLVDVIAEELA